MKAPRNRHERWHGPPLARSIFVPGIKLETLLRWVQDYDQHYRYFKEVEQSQMLSRQIEFNSHAAPPHKVITVITIRITLPFIGNTTGPRVEQLQLITTKIAELDSPGTPAEKRESRGRHRGFLWP